MFSLHIDTARTWRGGQNQVLLTVNGLRASGTAPRWSAHPDGELRRRAAEGLELIPLAPRTEMDLAAAWRFSRLDQALYPDIVHAHDPHGVAMASFALSMAAPAMRGARSEAGRLEARRLPPQAATRSRAGSIARSIASSPRPTRSARCSSPTASPRSAPSRSTRASTSSASPPRRRSTFTRRSCCRTGRRWSATSPRSCRTRDSGTSSKRRVRSSSEMPDARFVIARRGRAA